MSDPQTQTTLSEWLLAQIAADEKWASSDPGWFGAFAGRVLAECEAKRRIIELHDGFGRDCYSGYMGDEDPCSTVRALALPYADRPGYDEAWRP